MEYQIFGVARNFHIQYVQLLQNWELKNAVTTKPPVVAMEVNTSKNGFFFYFQCNDVI